MRAIFLPIYAVLAGLVLIACDAADGTTAGDGGGERADSGLSDAGVPEDGGGTDAPITCPEASLASGTTEIELTHDGMARAYRVFVPSTADLSRPLPLVINWHGLTSNAAQQQVYSQTDMTAETRGYLVAYPEGLGNSFNGGSCCSNLGTPPHSADDVGFGRAIVQDLAQRVCVDPRRVYSTGMSNGGYMSEWNACHAADLYAAVAPVSAMGILQSGCEPSRSIPLLAFNGTADGLVSYAVSQDSIQAWLERNGCEGDPERTMYGASYCDAWTACRDGAEVVHCTITDMAHCWPGIPLAIPAFCAQGGLEDMEATPMIFDFFERFRRP